VTDPVETKLCAARTRLILDRPFLGALVLRLPLVAAKPGWCPTAATDARKVYYNPAYVEALSLGQTQFLLAHLALHCALSHFARRQHRVRHRWDLACDLAINPLLVAEGLVPPPDALVLDEYRGMTAEEIYPLLDEADQRETLDQHVFDSEQSEGGRGEGAGRDDRDREHQGPGPGGGQQGQDQEQGAGGREPQDRNRGDEGDEGEDRGGCGVEEGESPPRPGPGETGDGEARPPPSTPDEREALRVQWQQRLAGAAQQALRAGKLGGDLARLVDHLLEPDLPWRALLARYLTQSARDDYSYTRPSGRREGPAIYPSLRSGQVHVVVALDTSGSLSEEEIGEFVAEVDALKGQVRAHLTLLACDAALAPDGPWEFLPWEDFRAPRCFPGGGGTSFVPVFRFVEEQDRTPDLLVYFTDARGEFPPAAPPYPVVWLVKGRAPVPWGQRIQLN
jgi:predicted metal-dependent peptidase